MQRLSKMTTFDAPVQVSDDDVEITVIKEQPSDQTITREMKCVISNVDDLHGFIKVVLELREIVKCPLCLDVMKNPVEMTCSHCFCEQCLQTLLDEPGDKITCPVCRHHVKKRLRVADESLLGYIQFVNDVNAELDRSFGCEVTDLGTKEKINQRFATDNQDNCSDIIPQTLPAKATLKRPKITKKRRAVSARKPKRPPQKHPTPIQTFVNDANRKAILAWLDNKNKFDRLTQTQQTQFSAKTTQESTGMPSVSQLNKTTSFPKRRRTKSLDTKCPSANRQPLVRYNSLPCESEVSFDFISDDEVLYVLEKAKEIATLKQKEEEFLESIESELITENPKMQKLQTENVNDNQKVYDLNVLEAYFTENMSKITSKETDVCDNNCNFKRPEMMGRDNQEMAKGNRKDTGSVEVRKKSAIIPPIDNENEDDVFSMATQKMTIEPTDEASDLSRTMKELAQQLNILADNLTVKKYSADLLKILEHLETGKENNFDDLHFTPRKSMKSAATQTALLKVNAEVQTHDDTLKVDVEVQTDDEVHRDPSQISAVMSEPFNGFFLNKLLTRHGEAQHTAAVTRKEPSVCSFDKFTFETPQVPDKQPEANSSILARLVKKYTLSDSLDNVDLTNEQIVQKQDPASDVEKKQVKRQLDYSCQSDQRRFKRIRVASDSDSDSEGPEKKKRNKYIQRDLSVIFESENPVAEKKDSEESFKFSDDINYNEFLDKIMSRYKNDGTQSATEQFKENDDLIAECDKRIEKAERKHSFRSGNRNENHVFSSEETFNSDKVLQVIDRDIAKCQLQPKRKNFSESLFGNSCENDQCKNNSVGDLDDSFDNEIAVLDVEDNDRTVVEKKIKILQNITLTRPKSRSDSDVDPVIISDDEMFSDVDVVEATPTKRVCRNIQRSQVPSPPFKTNNLPPPDFELDVNLILPPPPEFQEDSWTDMTIMNENPGETVLEKPETPPPTEDFPSPPKINRNRMGTSTPISGKPHTQKSLSISPIGYRENQNIMVAAKNSKFSPLTVIPKPFPLPERKAPSCIAKQQKSILSYVQPSNRIPSDSVPAEKPCITCSRLGKDQLIAVSSLTNKKLATYTNTFGPSVTHVVVVVNEKNRVKDHTIKFVCAVAAGIWVVSFKWIQECLMQNQIVPEEPFEVKDVSGVDGPRQSRLTRLQNPLLKGYKIYAAPPFHSITQADIENVVKLLGGKTVSKPDALLQKNGDICIIITEARATQDFEVYEAWLDTLRVITVDIEWLTRSVGQYRVLSLRPFALCSDDLLNSLGYPEELTANVPFSFSQSNYSTA